MTLREHPERVIARIEMAWTVNDLTAIEELIHPHAVLVARTGLAFSGRELFIKAFRRTPDFAFDRTEPGGSWQAWDATAVFDQPIAGFVGADRGRRRLTAREIWVLACHENIWSVVWHTTCERETVTGGLPS